MFSVSSGIQSPVSPLQSVWPTSVLPYCLGLAACIHSKACLKKLTNKFMFLDICRTFNWRMFCCCRCNLNILWCLNKKTCHPTKSWDWGQNYKGWGLPEQRQKASLFCAIENNGACRLFRSKTLPHFVKALKNIKDIIVNRCNFRFWSKIYL